MDCYYWPARPGGGRCFDLATVVAAAQTQPGRAAKAANTNKVPAKQSKSNTRKLKKADLEEDFFSL